MLAGIKRENAARELGFQPVRYVAAVARCDYRGACVDGLAALGQLPYCKEYDCDQSCDDCRVQKDDEDYPAPSHVRRHDRLRSGRGMGRMGQEVGAGSGNLSRVIYSSSHGLHSLALLLQFPLGRQGGRAASDCECE